VRPSGPDVNGKIQKAVWITATFAEEIEADLARFYHIDFLDLYRPGRLSWRKLLVLVEHLPPEAALNTAIRNLMPEDKLAENAGDPTKAPWSAAETLLASVIDEIRNLGWTYVQGHSDSSIPKPLPVPRPGVTGRRRLKRISLENARKLDPRLRGLSDTEVQAMLNRLTGRTP
jgi:hypothetical protein